MTMEGLDIELSLWQVFLTVCLIVITAFYIRNGAVRYYIKMFVFGVIVMTSPIFVIFYSLPRPRNWKNHLFVKWTCAHLLRPLFGLKVVAKGMENIKKEMAGIVVINHQSSIDVIPMFTHLPDRTVCLAKKELWYTGTFGLGSWLCGTVYIDRSNATKARKTMDETVDTIKSKKLKVIVFPEGTRNHKGSMLPFKKGAFHIAVQAQVPIIPLVFSSYEKFYSKPEKRFDPGKIVIEALPAIPTEGLTPDDVSDLTEKTRNLMLECFERNSKEAQNAAL